MAINLTFKILDYLSKEKKMTLNEIVKKLNEDDSIPQSEKPISRDRVFNYVKSLMAEGYIERVARGVYVLKE
ncbi:hypothetical protein ACO3UB_08315 (plasmid) [Methanocaldococcus sp. 16A]